MTQIMGKIWNKLLDASIYYSFDRTGFLRHQKGFDEKIVFPSNKQALITGGTSGIGLATATVLSKQGVPTIVTGRNKAKGQQVADQNKHLKFISMDLADWSDIKQKAAQIEALDYVVLNAGGMPEQYRQNDQGVEFQFASQLFGHYFLLKTLKETNKLNQDARVVWVTSGGMYLRKLELSSICNNPKYDKVATYANVKRGQVTILDRLKFEFPDQVVTAMHPGWVDTPAVRDEIPAFHKKMGERLRTPLEGADTILWLLATQKPLESGGLYFDRKKVKKHFFFFTKNSDRLADKLYAQLNQHYS